VAIEAWRWGVLALSALALVRIPRCRQAVPLWLVPLVILFTLWGGAVGARMNTTILPFLALFAAAALTELRAPVARGSVEDGSETVQPEKVPTGPVVAHY
jgi:hypothetical protein